MSNEFSWDKVLGSSEKSSKDELSEILESIEDTPEATLEAEVSSPVLDHTGAPDPHAIAPLPKNLVEPEVTNPAYDADYKPEYLIEEQIANQKISAAPRQVADDRNTKEQSKFFVDEQLQQPKFHVVESDVRPIKHIHIDEILKEGLDRKASDVHFTAGLPPMARVDGEIVPLNYEVLAPEHTRRLLYDILTDEQIQKFESTHELDMAYTAKGLARFRCNVYVQ